MFFQGWDTLLETVLLSGLTYVSIIIILRISEKEL